MATDLITHEQLLDLLSYNPETGDFTWLKKLCRSRDTVGKVAGHHGKKYVEIRMRGRSYLAHRLAWFFMTGEWPEDQVDHENLDSHDNRWTNLRLATSSQNSANKVALCTNKCGVKGVRLNKSTGKWRAEIWSDGRSIHLGMYETPEAASAAYSQAASELHGEFARS